MQLHGLHHLTAVSADAPGNHDFYTRVLGMRMVKKTVNQDDVSAYHLFYADGLASPGTDLTFFDWPVGREVRGTHAIVRSGLRVAGPAALDYWAARLAEHGVRHGAVQTVDGRLQLEFEDPEGQRLALVDDGGAGEAHAWARSPVPAESQIRGLGPITLSVPDLRPSALFLTEVMAMREARRYEAPDAPGTAVHVFEMGEGGPAAELHLRVEPHLPQAQPGAGGVHHVAFRVKDDEYGYWVDRLNRLRIPSSGPVDRYYFRSLYTREPNGILYEIATDGPGFAVDEPMETLGEGLALPPFLEPRRAEIERGLKPL
ncbi:ring-cleaving dioxygenase [Falsiroseomonas tokyonensis]|uniref:Ring-cleaving dioxygenase n=1 Tax=Falsiroseomonas tokyonensis TaxID=430521 RepID=A0ABV7BYP9_9PROT|nr:ring-cleaving dioxygenase [Falsiroseomonas tokyonensis]MBU8539178.1 ring-cleaving dioxygenase [Falsiroseomonas tokyonensis]